MFGVVLPGKVMLCCGVALSVVCRVAVVASS